MSDANRPVLAVLAVTALLSPLGLPAHAASDEPVRVSVSADDYGPRFHPGRTIVKFQRGRAPAFLPGSGAAQALSNERDVFVVANPPGLSVAAAVARYRGNPNVVYAEPDYELTAVATTPNDPRWAEQWDMTKISCPAGWDTQTNAGGMIVAVIDTGIDFTHPDLIGNLWDKGDGTHGYTCMGGACNPGGADDHGHGTHCAGTIGAVGNNGVGIAGINWDVQLMALKFLGSGGSGSTSDAVLCFNKIVELKGQGHNIRVTNNSWGGGGYSQALKDAMAAAETAGVVNVCAAGNNGSNVALSPMYPGAYDNRGIVSVLASDVNDVGAGFTNYGFAGVDIAAPGVSTLSTSPTGTCSLCDPTGYRLLSGTSMAAPHVAGVMAAMLNIAPSLTAHEARDVILDPASYDTLTDAKATSTSTGGRLNMAKAITSPKLTPGWALNQFPTLETSDDVTVNAGDPVTITATGADPDNDTLRSQWSRNTSTATGWLMAYMHSLAFPAPPTSGSSFGFNAPTLGRAGTVPYLAAVSDSRGGGAVGATYVGVSEAASPGQPPTGTLIVTPTEGPVPTTVNVKMTLTDPDGGTPRFTPFMARNRGWSAGCCYTSGSSVNFSLTTAGVYRVSGHAMDVNTNQSARQTQVVRIGGATGEPPLAAAVLSTHSGTAPLTVSWDMSGSTDADGTIARYYVDCHNGTATPSSTLPTGSCTFTQPGSYWMSMVAEDNAGNWDVVSEYVTALPGTPPPPPPPDTTPPTVAVTAPSEGASVFGNVSVTADASDASGIQKVEFFRDGGISLGIDSNAPYGVTWNSTAAGAGPHTLYAVATDGASNNGTSAVVNVSVQAVVSPSVTITSPANGANLPKNKNVTIAATVTTGTYPVSQVQFLVNGNVQCTDTTAPYSCTWKPTVKGTYQLQARATDSQGNIGSSAIVTVNAK